MSKGMYYLFENNKVCKIEKSKNDEENFSDESFDKLVEQRHGKIIKRSENVFDLIEVGDLVQVVWLYGLAEFTNKEYGTIYVNGNLKVSNENIRAIYKPNKKGDYICVWRRENEEH